MNRCDSANSIRVDSIYLINFSAGAANTWPCKVGEAKIGAACKAGAPYAMCAGAATGTIGAVRILFKIKFRIDC